MRDDTLRVLLRATTVFNVIGALGFAFPGSLGALVGMPPDVPGLYRASMALMVLLFAGSYAWLSRQPAIDRPMVAFAAIGKSSFFALVVVCWTCGAASGRFVVASGGDLAFAMAFAAWLWTAPPPAASRSA